MTTIIATSLEPLAHDNKIRSHALIILRAFNTQLSSPVAMKLFLAAVDCGLYGCQLAITKAAKAVTQ
jgi:hypothetical protein